MTARGELFDIFPEWQLHEKRRAAAGVKLELYRGLYRDRVKRMVRERVRDQDAAAEIAKAVNAAHGLAGSVTDACCVVYQRGANRELRGVGPEAERAFADLVTEAGFPEWSITWNQLSWFVGPIVLAPYVQPVRGRPRLGLHAMTADRTEVRRTPGAPDVIEAAVWQREDGVLVMLDGEAWSYWTEAGERLDGGRHNVAHGLDYCPAAALRSRPWIAGDWWGTLDHQGLHDATLEVAFRHALGLWVRQNTATPLVVIGGEIENIPALQALGHPTRPLYFNDPNVKVQVFPRQVSAADYLAEMTAIVNAATSRYGLPPSTVTFTNDNTNWGALSLAMTPGALALQRDAQAPWLRRSERTLWPIVADVARVSTHRHARALPPADEVEAAQRIIFPDLGDPADQLKRLDVFERSLKHGLANAVELELQRRPEMSRQEVEELIAANLDFYARMLEDLARRNVSMDPERGVQSIAELQGRLGGQASAEARQGDQQP